ncbi:MAG: MarR family transcriptional regulator [Turicibacter sp.]|nr:MarR family transcriptional regulator [Turicibacter sp.]
MEHLHDKLGRLMWLLKKQQLKTHMRRGPLGDASRGQGRILAFLQIKDGLSTKELSYMLDIRVSSLNEMLAKLEKGGFITRRPSESDKRVILNFLTEKGRTAPTEANEEFNLFGCLDPEEIHQLNGMMDKMIAHLETMTGTEQSDDEMRSWMDMARKRMGDDKFEKLMSMRQRGFGPRGRHGHGCEQGGEFFGFFGHDNREE